MKTLFNLLLLATGLYFFWKFMVWLNGPEEPVQTAEQVMADTIPNLPRKMDTMIFTDVDSIRAIKSMSWYSIGRWHRIYVVGNSWPEPTILSTTWIGEDTVIATWSTGQTDTLTRGRGHTIPYSSDDGILLPDRNKEDVTPKKLQNEIRKQFKP